MVAGKPKSEEALPVDEVFIDNDASLGSNIGPLFNNVHVKLSALTGSQAIKVLEKEEIYMGIINLSEGSGLSHSFYVLFYLT